MKDIDLTRPAIFVVVILLLVGAGSTYLLTKDGEEEEEVYDLDLSPLEAEMRSRLSSLLSEKSHTDTESVEDSLDKEIPEWIARTPFQLSGYTLSLEGRSIEVERTKMQINLPVPSPGWEDRYSGIHANSLDFGRSGAVPLIPSTRASISMDLSLQSLDNDGTVDKSMIVSAEVADPDDAWKAIAGMVETDSNGWGSGLARDVEYILNTLARIRTKNQYGFLNDQSEYNVINIGDVELALNFALALRITQITGQVPMDLVDSVDRYFSAQIVGNTMNPTGFRPWTTTEIDNFRKYQERTPSFGRRTLEDLLEYAVDVGHSDSADLFASYLYLKKTEAVSNYRPTPRLEGRDFITPLRELSITNQRQPTDKSDPYALEYHPSYMDQDSLRLIPHNSVIDPVPENESSLEPNIDVEEEYLIAGRDLEINGINNVRAWYTTSNPERTPESLINTTQPTRCGGVPFPAETKERNFRLQWDLQIKGDFTLTGNLSGWSGNSIGEEHVSEKVHLEFPLRIYTWFDERPRNDNIDFFDLNEGKKIAKPDISGWIVTPEANATEVFEKNISNIFRDAQGILTSLLRTIEDPAYQELLDEDSMWRRYQALSLYTLNDLKRWINEVGNITELRNYWQDYLLQGAIIPSLDPIHTMSMIYELDFSTVGDRLEIRGEAPQGYTIINVYGLIKRPIRFTFQVVSSAGITIDMDLDEGTYQVTDANSNGIGRIGSNIPNQPPQELVDLVLESNWWAKTGTVSATGIVNIEPLFNVRYLRSSETVNMTLSLVASGSDTDLNSPGSLEPSTFSAGEDIELLESLRDLKGSLPSNGDWFGITASRDPEGNLIPVERTIWLRNRDGSMEWKALLPLIGKLIHSSQSPAIGGFGQLEGVEVAFSERTPSWTVGMQGFDDFVSISYWDLNSNASRSDSTPYHGVFSFAYDGEGYSGSSEGWVGLNTNTFKPLW